MKHRSIIYEVAIAIFFTYITFIIDDYFAKFIDQVKMIIDC
jgi:hypothetical protein